MNVTPRGEPKVKIEYEGSINQIPWWIDLFVQAIVGIVIFAIILDKPAWITWLLSWLPGR